MSIYTDDSFLSDLKNWVKDNPLKIPEDSKDNNPQNGNLNNFYGKHHTEESKRLISENQKGWNHTDEAKEKIKEARKGKSRSEETKLKISLKNSKEGHHMWNKSPSEETIKKIIDTKKNNPYKHTEERRKKISEAAKLRWKNKRV